MTKIIYSYIVLMFIPETDYNYGHNIMMIFDVLSNFLFTTSETKADYYNKLLYTSCLTSCRTT